jgi:hypothetical protein
MKREAERECTLTSCGGGAEKVTAPGGDRGQLCCTLGLIFILKKTLRKGPKLVRPWVNIRVSRALSKHPLQSSSSASTTQHNQRRGRRNLGVGILSYRPVGANSSEITLCSTVQTRDRTQRRLCSKHYQLNPLCKSSTLTCNSDARIGPHLDRIPASLPVTSDQIDGDPPPRRVRAGHDGPFPTPYMPHETNSFALYVLLAAPSADVYRHWPVRANHDPLHGLELVRRPRMLTFDGPAPLANHYALAVRCHFRLLTSYALL